jgi:hypothetical protein
MQSGSDVSSVGNVNSVDVEAKVKAILKADEDHIHCPISQEVMRHPILASDGRHYELTELLTWIKRKGLESPVNREPLNAVLYDLGLQASLEKTFADSDRYPNYDRTAGLRELDTLFQHQRFLQLRELQAYQEEKLQVIEQVQVRRQAAVLQQIRGHALAVPVPDVRIDINARMEGQAEDLQIEGAPMNLDAIGIDDVNNADNGMVQMRGILPHLRRPDPVARFNLFNLLRQIPVHEAKRFFGVYMFVAFVLSAGYELTHSGAHDSSAAHRSDVVDHVAPVAMLVAAADVAVRHVSQNAHGLFNRMRGAANYFGCWVHPAARDEGDDMGPHHVRQHIL